MPKVYNVRVSTLEAELEFTIQQTTTVKQVFDQTVKTIGLREVWYFGLAYTDVNNERAWMNLDKKVLSHDIKPENPLQLRFRAKFYPEDAGSELIQDVTKRLFYLQAKEAILNDEVYCAPDTAVLLASYACQVKYGDRKNASITLEQLGKDRLLSPRVLEQHQLNPLEWATRIGGWWAEHGLMLREDAIVEYLKVAQDLEMFGVTYFDIRNKRGTTLLLGIDSLGLNIYDRGDKLTPKIGFAWSDLGGIAVSKKKFVIKASDKKTGDFTMFTSHERITKRIAALCLGNHELYLRRRQQDAIEVQQMKAQAREERMFREQERVKLEVEAKRREEAERERQALEARLRELEERAGDAQRSAEVAAAQLLTIQNDYEAAMRQREEADHAREQAEALRRQLEEAVSLEQEERKRLNEEYESALRTAEFKEEEVRAKEAELNATRSELDTIRVAIEQRAAEQVEREQLEAERQRLEAELRAAAMELQRAREEEEARVAAELERRQELAKIAIAATVVTAVAERQQSRSDEVDEVVQKIEAAPRPQASAIQQAALAELFDSKMSNAFADGKDDGEIQLTATNGNLPQTEIERVPEVKSDVALNQKLRELREELQQSRDDRKVVQNDILHAENQRQGRDKFKTLKQIRQGNTKKRVDEFESM